MPLTEADIETLALDWLRDCGYTILHGPDIAPDMPGCERVSYSSALLHQRLRDAIQRCNPGISADDIEEAIRRIERADASGLTESNRRFHDLLCNGITLERKRADGSIEGYTVSLVDVARPASNDFVAVNQFTIIENSKNRRPDIVVFVNGLPLAVIELKNPSDEKATIWRAFDQLQTYKQEIPALMRYAELLVVSDGISARIGSLTASKEWFKVWRTVHGDEIADDHTPELETLIPGVFAKSRFLDLIVNFIAFEEDTDSHTVHKILAGYHQYHAVNAAVSETLRAGGMQEAVREGGMFYARPNPTGSIGDKRVGVVWHTQGSGKSFTMLFYAARIARSPAMENPTIVVLTDRNDLDDQLYSQFKRCDEYLGQEPRQAGSVAELRSLLRVTSGGVVFTTIHKFSAGEKGARMPLLSDRHNIVVIADEAHRSQYDLIDGFARNVRDALPNAAFIGFTGTPIETTDANTRAIFGDYISVYDIQRAVADNATVPIYYESRIVKLRLNDSILSTLDDEFEEITEAEEADHKEQLKTKWAALEALVGDKDRLNVIADDFISHFTARSEAIAGKAMIVCMSRRICVELYSILVSKKPEWAHRIHVIMTGSADDGPEWQQHIRTKQLRKDLAEEFKRPSSEFDIVIVRDMWLTGFDAPCLSTMYIDKPMRGHGLMQAIARVNRVFRDKPGGLVVDYLGLADSLKQALVSYTQSGGRGTTNNPVTEAVSIMLEKYDSLCAMLHGFDWTAWYGDNIKARLMLLAPAKEHIYSQQNGKARFNKLVLDIKRAFAICAADAEALKIRDDIAFFEAVNGGINKEREQASGNPERIDAAIRQLVDRAITADQGVIDVFTAAGIRKPDISILSEEFLAEVRNLRYKNVAAELLETLLRDEIRERTKRNVVESKRFSEMLQETLNRYHNRAIETQEVIEELIRLAADIRNAVARGEALGLNDDEMAFYDALSQNDAAREVMGDTKLKLIATELVQQVRASVTIDWNLREQARAAIRVLIKRILRKHGYPPDLESAAAQLVLQQAEVLCEAWV